MNHFQYKQGELYCEDVPLGAIAAEAGTPLYLYSQAELLERANAYLHAVTPSPSVCYAVKANGNPEIIRILGDAGLGADVTSGGELFLAQRAGIPPARIVFSGVGKTEQEIETAITAGIKAIHLESEMELAVVMRVASRLQRETNIGIRVNPDVAAGTHGYISTGQHAHKFGLPVDIARRMFEEAARSPYLRPTVLATHIGSQIIELSPFKASATILLALAAELKELGIHLSELDLGGGLGIDYTQEGAPSIGQWLQSIAQPVHRAGYRLVVEPGRSIVGPAGVLVTRILYTKEQGGKHFLITDAGMNDLIRPALYQAYHPILPVHAPSATQDQQLYDVVGPVCETGDWLARDRLLAPAGPGDLLAVMHAGAYGFAMSSNYNGRLRPAELLVSGDQCRVIRQRQEYRHLLDGWTSHS